MRINGAWAITVIALLASAFLEADAEVSPPALAKFKDLSLSADVRVEDLISNMTLEEKAAQLGHTAPAIARLGVPEYNWWGATGVSRPEYVDRSDPIGVRLETAGNAVEALLCLPVLCRDTIALRTSSAGVLRRHEDQRTAVPRQLVVQLAAELEPTLIENGLVQAGLGPNVLARIFD